MQYTAQEVTIKNPDWKIVTAIGLDGIQIKEGSINRKDKVGAEFPNFDGIIEGATFQADPWHNPAGKWYFFPPKAKTTTTGGKFNATGAIKQAQERKAEMIEQSQDRKQEAISMAGAQRDAVLMVTTFEANTPFPTEAELKAKIEAWMKYFLNLGSQPFL